MRKGELQARDDEGKWHALMPFVGKNPAKAMQDVMSKLRTPARVVFQDDPPLPPVG